MCHKKVHSPWRSTWDPGSTEVVSAGLWESVEEGRALQIIKVKRVCNFNFSSSGKPKEPRFDWRKQLAFGIISRIRVQTDPLAVSIVILSYWSLHTLLTYTAPPLVSTDLEDSSSDQCTVSRGYCISRSCIWTVVSLAWRTHWCPTAADIRGLTRERLSDSMVGMTLVSSWVCRLWTHGIRYPVLGSLWIAWDFSF